MRHRLRAMPFLSGWGGFCYLNPKYYYWTDTVIRKHKCNRISKSNFLILIRFWNWLYMMIVKEIVSFFRPQGFACVCSFMTMFRSVNDFDIWKVEVLKALYQDFTRYHVNKLWIFPPERQHKISIKLSHKKYTYAMETLTKIGSSSKSNQFSW